MQAPSAGSAGKDFYPAFTDKAAVLVVRLAKNHPLPDGDKRAAWAALRLFTEVNGWARRDYPSIDDAEKAMVVIASSEWDEKDVTAWLTPRLEPPKGSPAR